LVEKHEWNNSLQIKTMQICDTILDSTDQALKSHFLSSTSLAESLVSLSESSTLKLESGNCVRKGFMGMVIHISNRLQSMKSDSNGPSDQAVVQHLTENSEKWVSFTNEELAISNEKNSRVLGS